MPIPQPSENEEDNKFISRCMEFHNKEGKFDLTNKAKRKQALAICYSQLKTKKENIQIKTMSDILNEKV